MFRGQTSQASLVQEDWVIKEKRTVYTFTFSCLGGAKGDPEEYLHQHHPLLLAGGIARRGGRTKGVLVMLGPPPPTAPLEVFTQPVSTPCGHSECIEQYWDMKGPLCFPTATLSSRSEWRSSSSNRKMMSTRM